MTQTTATLCNAHAVDLGDHYAVSGDIYGDTRNRFVDGERIRTSPVLSFSNGVLTTRNSTYRIEGDLTGAELLPTPTHKQREAL